MKKSTYTHGALDNDVIFGELDVVCMDLRKRIGLMDTRQGGNKPAQSKHQRGSC